MKKSNLYLTILIVALIAIAPYSMSAQDMVTAVGQEGLEKTVSYDIASFTDIRDKKLEDVLKKMPGITEATWEGPHTYKYNGMDIKKVYVNGLDVLEGNYEPVYNMKPEDVERLEISENHVSEKVMKGMQFSNDAAINVILKEEAASKWSGSVKGGLGLTSLLANADVNAINIGNKMQSTVLFKADNTGLDFSGALKGFGGENFRGGPPPVISGSGTDYSVKKFLNVVNPWTANGEYVFRKLPQFYYPVRCFPVCREVYMGEFRYGMADTLVDRSGDLTAHGMCNPYIHIGCRYGCRHDFIPVSYNYEKIGTQVI